MRFSTARSPRRLLVLALSGLTVALGTASPAAAAVAPGLQIAPLRGETTTQLLEAQMQTAKQAGAKLVRVELRWDLLEPTAAGQRDPAYLTRMDEAFAAAKARGLRIMGTFIASPCWASSAPESLKQGCGSTSEKVASYPPKSSADFASAAAFVAKRYGSTLGWIEIWNEPDHVNEVYWAGGDKAKTYASLLKAAYPAIKKASPGTKVLGGAMVGADGKFLKALYKAGAKGKYDALSVHYYDLVLASMRAIRQVMIANKDRKPVFLGEFGWTSCAPKAATQGGHACVSRAQQGRNLIDVYRALKKAKYVIGAVVYTVQDTTQYDFGLLDVSGAAKPALAALRTAFTSKGKPSRVKLKLKRSGGQVVASGTAPVGDALELDAYKGGRLRYKITFRLDRSGAFRIRIPRQLGSRGLRVRVYQYWLGGGTSRSI